MPTNLNVLKSGLDAWELTRPVGRVLAIDGGMLRLTGLHASARIGDRLLLHRRSGLILNGEVLQISDDTVSMLPDTAPNGVAIGDRVVLVRTPSFAPANHWIGRVIDPFGPAG